VGTIAYVRGLQEGESCMYAGCRKVNRVCTQVAIGTILYVRELQKGQSCTSIEVFWVGASTYRLTSTTVQVTSTGRTSGLQQICGQRKFPGIC
jgi:hypothetical protein